MIDFLQTILSKNIFCFCFKGVAGKALIYWDKLVFTDGLNILPLAGGSQELHTVYGMAGHPHSQHRLRIPPPCKSVCLAHKLGHTKNISWK